MSRFGKCQNLSGCLLAYRGEETEVEKDQPFICAECGKPLAEVKSPAKVWLRYVYALGGVVVLAVIAFLAFPKLSGLIVKHKEHHEEGERPSPEQPPENNPPPSEITPATPIPPRPEPARPTPQRATPAKPAPDESAPVAGQAEPPKAIVAPPQFNGDVNQPENKSVKAEVLTRIDQIPGLTQANKDRLYIAVERAKKMGKILTIPFGSGKTEMGPPDIDTLKAELEKPDVATLRGNATAVFVILGYADPKGDVKKNIAISQSRADTVLKAMRDKCGVFNVMHTVGMGGSKLLDADNLEKNRIVEIWIVIP